ncbi:MAG TPA: methylated-DNA--[protein]-cysteine S-methyltransferase [Methylophilaceae bacterium]|jgi:methylated-DNA-[protein]-cysteine S-methyltransferase
MHGQTFTLERIASPVGELLVLTDEQQRLRAIDWQGMEQRMHRLLREHYGKDAILLRDATQPSAVRHALDAYFAGDMNALKNIPTATGGTAFQVKVWNALRRIPVGRTMSYGGLAMQIGHPRSARAVGLANGSNPIAIVVPCHRVIGANGSLTGFAGGLERKRWLLEHENAQFVVAQEAQLEMAL